MKHTPYLDPRTREDLLREIGEKSRAYTPEWRYEGRPEDAGGALSSLFADLFYETLDRFNRVPHKNYIAFLNLLDVRRSPVTPARGVVSFKVDPALMEEPVAIPAGAQVYPGEYEAEGTELAPYFELDDSIMATPASLVDMMVVDPGRDRIVRLDMESGYLPFFRADPEANLQKHRFALTHEDVFSLTLPCLIRVELEHKISFYTEKCAAALATDAASWTYFDGEVERPFERVYAKGATVYLEKRREGPIVTKRPLPMPSLALETPAEGEPALETPPPAPEMEIMPSIFCTVTGEIPAPDITVKSLKVHSALLEDVSAVPDALYCNDQFVDEDLGGYCFGRPPMNYDCFYIACGEIFSKRGARVNIAMNMRTIAIDQMLPEQQYDYKKYIIDKGEKQLSVKDMFVSSVVWEYWNGLGWSRLKVEGDKNPFSCQQDGQKSIWFICPENMSQTDVNAESGLWIRARVAFVENNFDLTARILLPFVSDVRLQYEYDESRSVQAVAADNNCEKAALEQAFRYGDLDFTLYKPLAREAVGQYLAFDLPPVGYPVTLHFELVCGDSFSRTLEYQLYCQGGFRPLRVLDRTDKLEKSGIVSLFVSDVPEKCSMFGTEAYWIRILDLATRYEARGESRMVVRAVTVNAASVTQQNTMLDERFSAEPAEAGKVILLEQRPVLSAEVWVNELADISQPELRRLGEIPQALKEEYDDGGELTGLWVRWEQRATLGASGPFDRHFTLDSMEGAVAFGDGTRGRMPTAGTEAIRVDYKFGGGSRGNLGPGRIDSLSTGIDGVASLTNFLPTYGGNDLQSLETVERLGPMRLKHGGRVLSCEDYESIVEELFGQVRDVRCFRGYNEKGEKADGHVTVVVMARDYANRAYALLLCDEIMRELKGRCDMQVLALNMLHVIPAEVITVNCSVKLLLDEYGAAVSAETAAKGILRDMIENKRQDGHYIGNLPGRVDVFAALKGAKHITAVEDVMLEGLFYREGRKKTIALGDGQEEYPYAVALSGTHRIRL